jgi:hypothetical protein
MQHKAIATITIHQPCDVSEGNSSSPSKMMLVHAGERSPGSLSKEERSTSVFDVGNLGAAIATWS